MTSPPPDADEGPGQGPHLDHHPQAASRRQRTRGLIVWGRHSRWVCAQRSHQNHPCPRCCRCWSPDRCEHGDSAAFELEVA